MQSQGLAGRVRRASLLLVMLFTVGLVGGLLAPPASANPGAAVAIAVQVANFAQGDGMDCKMSARWETNSDDAAVIRYLADCTKTDRFGQPPDDPDGVVVQFIGTRTSDGTRCTLTDAHPPGDVQGVQEGFFGWINRYKFAGTTGIPTDGTGWGQAMDCNVSKALIWWGVTSVPPMNADSEAKDFLLGAPYVAPSVWPCGDGIAWPYAGSITRDATTGETTVVVSYTEGNFGTGWRMRAAFGSLGNQSSPMPDYDSTPVQSPGTYTYNFNQPSIGAGSSWEGGSWWLYAQTGPVDATCTGNFRIDKDGVRTGTADPVVYEGDPNSLPPLEEPGPPADGCDTDITDPSTWLCGLIGLVKSLLGMVGQILGWLLNLGSFLVGLLVPDPDALGASMGKVQTAWDGSAPAEYGGAFLDMVTPLTHIGEGGKGGCAGPTMTFPIPSAESVTVNPFSACNAGVQGFWTTWVMPLLAFLLYLGAFFGGMRALSKAFGVGDGVVQAA